MFDHLRFLGHFARRPFATGAVLPSSKILARTMAAGLGKLADDQVILELGPGTGAFTRALRGAFPERQIVACERDPRFVALMRRRYPDVRTIESCASELPARLAAIGLLPEQIGGVVSGLPVLSLPDEVVAGIFEALAQILPPGRAYVQFTYWKRSWREREIPGFRLVEQRRVFRNVPPATVLCFRRTAESPALVGV